MKPEDKMIAYREIYHEYGSVWEPMKLTGKWALDRRPGYADYALFLENKGLIFKHWVHEDDIKIAPAPHTIIMECGK